MWLKLSDELFFFGQGGVISVTQVGHLPNSSSAYRTELAFSNGKVYKVRESIEDINLMLERGKREKAANIDNLIV